MSQERWRNQRRLLDQTKLSTKRIVVIGAGAIGSYFVLAIAKMGAENITIYDDDKIEEHNFSNQMHAYRHMGVEKTKALAQMAVDFGGLDVNIEVKGRWTPETAVPGDIIVAAVDNMDVRKALWDYYKQQEIEFYIEGRMAAQVFRVYGIDPADEGAMALYETKLYPQSEAVPEPCGEKSIIYTVYQVAGQMAAQLKRYIQKEYRPTEVCYDCLNDEITKTYTIVQEMEVIEVPEEVGTV